MTHAPERVWHDLARNIDTFLANHGMLCASLKPGYPGFDVSPADALRFYGGPTPVYALWLACRDVDALRRSWTGAARLDTPEAVERAQGGSGGGQ